MSRNPEPRSSVLERLGPRSAATRPAEPSTATPPGLGAFIQSRKEEILGRWRAETMAAARRGPAAGDPAGSMEEMLDAIGAFADAIAASAERRTFPVEVAERHVAGRIIEGRDVEEIAIDLQRLRDAVLQIWAELREASDGRSGALLLGHAADAATASAVGRYAAMRSAAVEEDGAVGSWEWDGRVELASAMRFRQIHGIPEDEPASYARFLRSVHAEDRARVEGTLAAARSATDGRLEVEYRVALGSGEVRWVASRARVLAEGGALRLLGTARDVTELRHERDSHRLLWEASKVLASTLDRRLVLGCVARLAVPRLADWCAVDVVREGKPSQLAFEHVDPSKVELVRARRELQAMGPELPGQSELYEDVSRVAEEGSPRSGAARLLGSLGVRSAMVVPMVARRRTVGAISFASAESGRRYGRRDLAVAESLATRAALALDAARLYEESQAAVAARERILAVVSHDLRNPLGVISMATAVLRQMPACRDATVQKQVDAIQRSASRIASLTDDILDAASIHAGGHGARAPLHRMVHDAGGIGRAATAAVAPIAREVDVELACNVGAGDLGASCDEQRMMQLLTGILSRTLRLCRPGGRLTLDVVRAGPSVRFVLSGATSTIGRVGLQHAMEAKQDLATLSGAKGIADAPGGAMRVADAAGDGARIEIDLPAARPVDGGAPTPEHASAPASDELAELVGSADPALREALRRRAREGDERALVDLVEQLPDSSARGRLLDVVRSLDFVRLRALLERAG